MTRLTRKQRAASIAVVVLSGLGFFIGNYRLSQTTVSSLSDRDNPNTVRVAEAIRANPEQYGVICLAIPSNAIWEERGWPLAYETQAFHRSCGGSSVPETEAGKLLVNAGLFLGVTGGLLVGIQHKLDFAGFEAHQKKRK